MGSLMDRSTRPRRHGNRTRDTGGGNGRFLARRFGDRKTDADDSKNLGTSRRLRDASFLKFSHPAGSIVERTGAARR